MPYEQCEFQEIGKRQADKSKTYRTEERWVLIIIWFQEYFFDTLTVENPYNGSSQNLSDQKSN